MADSQAADSLIKKEPEVPAHDPIVSRSTSGIILVSVLLLMASLVWSLYDETYGQRPWKGMQREFVARYTRYLKSLKEGAGKSEEEIKESPEYQALAEKAKAAKESVQPDIDEINAQLRKLQPQLDAITDPFQNQRGRLMVINYNVETARESAKEKYRKQAEQKRNEVVSVEMPADDGSGKIIVEKLDYPHLESRYNKLREQKATLLGQKAEKLKEPSELEKKRDDYLKNQLIGLAPNQLQSLISAQDKFDYSILAHQINVPAYNVVDRCEVCHLGTRSPIDIKADDMAATDLKPDALAKAFVSHPNRDLLAIHNPDKFGCSGCHWGNGRATTSDEKAHGHNEHWMYPLFAKDNMEAGCQQCHAKDRITPGAETVNLGRDLFYVRGCVGCHRYEGFDRETDALNNSRQNVKQLEDQIVANEKQIRADSAGATQASDAKERAEGDEAKAAFDRELERLKDHQQSLTVTNSLLAARVDQLNLQTKYLMQDQKKVGPNLKDVGLKLRKEWIPGWLKDPQEFRPGTKMPTFWRFGKDQHGADEIKAIAVYLWQSGFEGKVPEQQKGDANHGKEIFEGRGCLACHSIGEGGNRVGGTFAANLTKVGAKANFDYIVRWIYNPRARYAPYCPKEKRDLTPEDYAKQGKPYIFDTELHSKCPNDGAELQVQNMTVMPDFRLSEQDARDVATYIFSLSSPPQYADASFMDDPNLKELKEQGRLLIKQFGCAGCHEIKGFEEEQRIGKELTVEGATPIERLDFALATKAAEEGHDPAELHREAKGKSWYNARGFFEHKINDPSFYDEGKEKAEQDWLRMPKPYMNPQWRTALTTFLLGSVGAEGANVSKALFYEPQDQRRQDIQNGWWVIKKYNCMGCHAIQPGQRMVVAKGSEEQYLDGSVLMNLPQYQADLAQLLPPRLTSEGARVDPNWLLRFLHDPSLGEGKTGTATSGPSGAKPGATADQSSGKLVDQPGMNRNGVRPYLQARMPTFNFSPDELQTLVRFFVALSGQDTPYIKDKLEPLSDQERTVARQIFTNGTPCLKCHITGEATHDAKAIAPNFLLAGERLKPEWTFRWLRDPAQISPGTAMPSALFKMDNDRWVVSAPNMPKDVNDYHGDHAWLLVRYMFLMTPDENSRLLSASPAAPAATAPAASAPQNNSKTNGQTGWYRPSQNQAGGRLAFARRNARSPG